MWVSFDDGDHWQSLQLNLPHTSMRDLWIHENDLIVATHGRGFWILDDVAPLREISPEFASSAHLFAPGEAYRVQRDINTDTPIPPDEPMATNPPEGASSTTTCRARQAASRSKFWTRKTTLFAVSPTLTRRTLPTRNFRDN